MMNPALSPILTQYVRGTVYMSVFSLDTNRKRVGAAYVMDGRPFPIRPYALHTDFLGRQYFTVGGEDFFLDDFTRAR